MIPLMDLAGEYNLIKDEINKAIEEVLAGGNYVLGASVALFEEEMAAYCNVSCGVGVASGTDALVLSLLACGVGRGDEVITTPFTFFATAEAVARVGATPVFVDIDPKTFNLDVKLLEQRVTARTAAVIPVHLFGQMADMGPVLAVARKYGLAVIEDACQAVGARQRGRPAGSFGHAGCFSFFPTKNLGGYGDGGMVVTSDRQLADKIKKLRVHGSEKKYYHSQIGFNSRLDELQAAVLRVKLRHLKAWNKKRAENAGIYDRRFKTGKIICPYVRPYNSHTYHLYTIRSAYRRQICKGLAARGISYGIYYPLPLHLQEALAYLGYSEGDFPEAEKASREVLSLPVHPCLSPEQVDQVAGAVLESLEKETGGGGSD